MGLCWALRWEAVRPPLTVDREGTGLQIVAFHLGMTDQDAETLIMEHSENVAPMTTKAADFFWQRDTYLLEGEEDYSQCEAATSYLGVKNILDGRMKRRHDLTVMVLRSLRLFLIRAERIELPAGNLELWFEEQYGKMTVQDKLQDSTVAYVSEESLHSMYDMGKPPYSSRITNAGIADTSSIKEATE